MAKKFIQKAIKHPGRVKNAAKRAGISVHAEAVKMSHSSDPSVRGAGNLALRFQKGGDLHGGSTLLPAGHPKAVSLREGRGGNLRAKHEFKHGLQDARDGKA